MKINFFLTILLIYTQIHFSYITATDESYFGHISVSKELFIYIRSILANGKTILELGSGWASGEFSKYYTVYSIEHDQKWLHKYKTNYIYAPITDGWYDISILEKHLPKKYHLILVDGPPSAIGRNKFYDNLHLFNTDVPIIFDDVQRKPEYNLMSSVAQKLNRKYKIFASSKKKFGVII